MAKKAEKTLEDVREVNKKASADYRARNLEQTRRLARERMRRKRASAKLRINDDKQSLKRQSSTENMASPTARWPPKYRHKSPQPDASTSSLPTHLQLPDDRGVRSQLDSNQALLPDEVGTLPNSELAQDSVGLESRLQLAFVSEYQCLPQCPSGNVQQSSSLDHPFSSAVQNTSSTPNWDLRASGQRGDAHAALDPTSHLRLPSPDF